jgi:hypoxanthine phosphoribosyltransferase
MRTLHDIDCYDWADIDAQSRDLAGQITDTVDVIVAVLRGGAVPATILANELDVDCVVGTKIAQNGQVGGVADATGSAPYIGQAAEVLVPMNAVPLAGAHVLIVDDVLDSGETLRRVRDDVVDQGAASARIATLQVKTYSSLRPDFWVEERTNWLFYPWMSRREFEAMRQSLARRRQG